MNNPLPDAYTFKTLTDAAPYPVYLCLGEEMVVRYANQATLTAWGKTEEVIGKPFLEAIPEIKNQPFYQLLLDVYYSGAAYYSAEQQADLEINGQLKSSFFKFSYQPFHDPSGQIIGVFCFATDVTELVKNRIELQASKESLRLALEAAELGTFDKDLVKGTNYWDSRCRELFNISHQNEVTYENDFLPGLHPDDRERVDKHLKDFVFVKEISGGRLDVEYRTIGLKDKRVRWIKSKGKVFFDADQKPVRFIGSVIDITEQRQAEIRKNDFISIASHELKTPLTTIKAQVQLLIRRSKNQGNDFISESLERLNRQVNNMSALVNNFLDNNRLLEGKLSFQQEVFNIDKLLDEVISDHRMILFKHSIVLSECENVMVMADRSKIGQVLENLISNAVKYSPSGSTITIGCTLKNKIVKISVADQGIGISPTEQKKLFERFYRVDNELSKNVSGFGLGLYLVAEILRNHNTKISVESKLGEGSLFFFHLPLITT